MLRAKLDLMRSRYRCAWCGVLGLAVQWRVAAFLLGTPESFAEMNWKGWMVWLESLTLTMLTGPWRLCSETPLPSHTPVVASNEQGARTVGAWEENWLG